MTSMARPARVPARVMAVAACVAVLASGCTMCPDPYDYSGPVPNGSPPQNDFRARSNGILPLSAAPKPWPPIVKTEPASDPAPGPGLAIVADYSFLGIPFVENGSVSADSSGTAAREDSSPTEQPTVLATDDILLPDTAVAAEVEENPAPSLVMTPVAEQDAATEPEPESDVEAADAPEPIASAQPASAADRRGLPTFREASRWLRWR